MADEVTPLPSSGTKAAQVGWALRLAAKYLPPVLLSLAAFIGAGQVGNRTAKEASKEAVDTSLQATKKPVDELQLLSKTMGDRLTKIEADILVLQRYVRNVQMSNSKKRAAERDAALIAAALKAQAPPAPKLTPVPATLEQAQQAGK
jgi:hypothetical protein